MKIVSILLLASLAFGCDSGTQTPSGTPPTTPPQTRTDAPPVPQTPDTSQFPAEDFACTTSADCCLVDNGCGDGLALVTAKNQEQTAAAFRARREAARGRDAAAWDGCWPCIPPAVEVGCVAGRCVAERVAVQGLDWDRRLTAPHCGSLLAGDGGAPDGGTSALRSAQSQVGGPPPTYACH